MLHYLKGPRFFVYFKWASLTVDKSYDVSNVERTNNLILLGFYYECLMA